MFLPSVLYTTFLYSWAAAYGAKPAAFVSAPLGSASSNQSSTYTKSICKRATRPLIGAYTLKNCTVLCICIWFVYNVIYYNFVIHTEQYIVSDGKARFCHIALLCASRCILAESSCSSITCAIRWPSYSHSATTVSQRFAGLHSVRIVHFARLEEIS